MTERLSDVMARIGSVRQLSSVIRAMRGIAAARAREARERVEGVRAYARTVGAAIGQALALVEGAAGAPSDGRHGHVVIALCAEQGFAGPFNRRVLDVAERLMSSTRPGSGTAAARRTRARRGQERGLKVGWSASMVAHVDQAAALADRVTEQLYQRLEQGQATRVSLVHATPEPAAEIRHVVERTLAPFDFARFPRTRNPSPPLVSLPPPAILLAQLAEEYVFAELCEALTLSLAAENEARMRAMTAAKSNVSTMLDDLVARSRQLRQEEITNEIIELGARKAPGRPGASRGC